MIFLGSADKLVKLYRNPYFHALWVDIFQLIPYWDSRSGEPPRHITRWELARATKSKDRDVRRAITWLRQNGCIIVNSPDGGYYYPGPEDLDVIEAWYNQERSRALTILRNCKTARDYLICKGRIVRKKDLKKE